MSGPEAPVSRVAKAAVHDRLDRVRHYLPLAAKKCEKDIEYVHQLRVSTRRAQAALDIFHKALPKGRARRLRKQLQRMRRCAGEARDLDVLEQRLASLAAGDASSGVNRLIDDVAAERRRAQGPLVRMHKRLKRRKFKSQIKKLCQRIRWRGDAPEPTFGEVARRALRSAVDEFFSAALADLSDPFVLHQVRIAGKRLRYAIELLAAAFDESLRTQLYPVFKDVQDWLGNVNDHETAKRLFVVWSEQTEPATAFVLRELAAAEQRQIEKTSQDFCAWWTDERAYALRQQFDTYLTPPDVSPPRQPGGEPADFPSQASATNESAGAKRQENRAVAFPPRPPSSKVS